MRIVDLHHDEQIPEHALSSQLHSCPLCGDQRSQPLFTVQSSPDVRLQPCVNCHGGFVDRVPSQAALDAYYANNYATKVW